MGRRLAITKRLSLDMIEGWDDNCYMVFTPISINELGGLMDVDKMTELAALNKIVALLQEHFVSGKVLILDEGAEAGGAQTLVDAEKEDVGSLSPDVINQVFETVTGENLLDPKEKTPTATPSWILEAGATERASA